MCLLEEETCRRLKVVFSDVTRVFRNVCAACSSLVTRYLVLAARIRTCSVLRVRSCTAESRAIYD
jgi:hypothetical protein